MYGYLELIKDSEELCSLGYRKEIIGKTVYGKQIPAFLRGDKPRTLIVGGTHARENITSKLVARLAKEYEGEEICFLPLLNIDGAEIVERGLESVPIEYRELVKECNTVNNFKLWKANGRGVDINVNYDADWGTGRSNLFTPSYENYVGEYPHSEPETRASVELVKRYRFSTLISYHAKGEIIYARYKGRGNGEREKLLSSCTGYSICEAEGSAGGFKDWFIRNSFGDGYTIEVGSDDYAHPLPDSIFKEIYLQNANICALLGDERWILTKNL